MFAAAKLEAANKTDLYAQLVDQARGLLAGERDRRTWTQHLHDTVDQLRKA